MFALCSQWNLKVSDPTPGYWNADKTRTILSLTNMLHKQLPVCKDVSPSYKIGERRDKVKLKDKFTFFVLAVKVDFQRF